MNPKSVFFRLISMQIAFCLAGVGVLLLSGTTLKFDGVSIFVGIPLGLAFGLVVFSLVAMFCKSTTSFGNFLRENAERNRRVLGSLSIPVIVCVSMVVGVSEEVLFRGALLGALSETVNPIFGLVVSSILFGVLHFGSISNFVFTSLYGLALGVTYYFSESIILVAAWHFFYDLLALIFLVKFPGVLRISESAT